MNAHWRRVAGILLVCALDVRVWAGGSGLNVVVVVNQNSTNSVQLGNYYCEKRQVPPQNLLRASWSGGKIVWMKSDFESVILNPLRSMLAARQLTNQIDYVLLSMDFPYRVDNGGSAMASGTNSTTSALFYGFKTDYPPLVNPGSCSLPPASSNAYAGSEGLFRSVAPGSSRTNFLAVMLTASNLAQAKLVIDRAVACDGTFATQTVYLAKTTDLDRNIRYAQFDNAIFNARLRANYSIQRTNANPGSALGVILGLESGTGDRGLIGTSSFVPGALADNLTSWGGCIFEYSGQLSIIAFLNAGAAGCHGTVIEPCAYLAKFPSPQNHFYQARGFTMAECYYQSLTNPYQGLLLGDPLAAPFASFPAGAWNSLPADSLLKGTTNLSVQFTAADARHPVQQVDLFVDGTFAQTLTNIPPRTNNVLHLTLNGYPTNYTVPAAATIQSVASNLALRLNHTSYSNATKVKAFAYGDRVELRSLNRSKPGWQTTLTVSNSAGTASALTSFVVPSAGVFLDTIAYGMRGFTNIGSAPAIGAYLRITLTKTNGAVVTLGITNNVGGNTLPALTQGLVNMVNTNAALQGSDGVVAEDFMAYDPFTGQLNPRFNLRARSAGWDAAQFQASLSGSPAFTIQPAGTQKLEQNLADLQPRNHLYVNAGLTNLPLTFAFNTTTQADGYHELTAVAYEGSHVRTQKRVAQTVRIQNSPLSAAFTTLLGDTNSALEATLQFLVIANTNNISKIELFSTGGSRGSVLNQSNALFSVAGSDLGLGLHPFYALVTASNGKQYRTETKWIRLVGADSPFRVTVSAPPARLSWSAAAGRSYDILTATNVTNAFQLGATLTPTNSAARWTDTSPAASRRFYRVRTSH
ncbi:MAG TPA: TIGR03790 family protein [Candidatus Paceibacterota bacterium]|nr:TIGR03790 family protein [Verrucomicrobiota bacterium]HSA09662.1 TIGR03790 family protein [Candidatus Paceibacterota bacterium]